MKLHVKAALLSGLVLPGLGQLVKGARVKGGIMIALVNVFLLAALYLAVGGMGDLLVTARLSGTDAARQVLDRLGEQHPGVKYLLAAFLVLWAWSIVDALLGKGEG